MGKPTGFLRYSRIEARKRPVQERIRDFREFETPLEGEALTNQASRCMDCGIPHCHTFGCPVNNRIPEWNDLVYRNRWQEALQLLQATDNFPEFTGRVCPAPCESACTLALDDQPVTIRQIELQIIETGWQNGWVLPVQASVRSGKRVAVIGSGPAGLAAAQQLARRGHDVVVFERADRIGGLLRYGIPDFKLEKWIIDRRLEQMRQEGVVFECGVEAGVDLSFSYLQRHFHALVLAVGATQARDLTVPGRELGGIHPAMDYLVQQNRLNAGEALAGPRIEARDRDVVVIGGGDTGADCVGTAKRQGARHITQIEILPQPPERRAADNPWPTWPQVLRTASSHQEGCDRLWHTQTLGFSGQDGRVQNIILQNAAAEAESYTLAADLVLLALGFSPAEPGPLFEQAQLTREANGRIAVDAQRMCSRTGLFAAGDCVSGASLVVRAIAQGRQAAAGVEQVLLSS